MTPKAHKALKDSMPWPPVAMIRVRGKRKPPPPITVPVDVTLLEQMQTLINGIMMYKRRPKRE